MSSLADYVRRYFDERAGEWVGTAYDEPTAFPIGEERVRLAMEAVADSLQPGATLVDLGCGGGQLCAHAARLGVTAIGVDVAGGMLDQASRLRDSLPPGESSLIRYVEAAFDENGLEAESADAVTALGLIEYLPEDGPLLAEARRLLRPGGRFAVSCRNRLLSLQTANRYTKGELESGEFDRLLSELAGYVEAARPEDVRELAAGLAGAAEELRDAAQADAAQPPETRFEHDAAFTLERRQHSPAELHESARAAGLEPVAVCALHMHPLPPALEQLSPRAYNALALAWQRPLERSPAGLAYASTFIAVYERPS